MSANPKKKRARPAVPQFGKQQQQLDQLDKKQKTNDDNEEDNDLMNDLMSKITDSVSDAEKEKQQKEQKQQQEKQKKVSMMDKISSMFKKKVKQDDTNTTSSNQQNSNGGDIKQKPQLSMNKEYNRSFLNIEDEEYDPIKPNDYEKFKQQQSKKKGQKSLQGELMERKKKQELEKKKKEEERLKEEEARQKEEQEKMQLEHDQKFYSLPDQEISKIEDDSVVKTEEKALNMMKKFGYKVGKGLGKQEQGRTSAIIHMKVGDNVGVITQGQGDISSILSQDILLKDYIEKVGMTPSRILVLLNMVGANEIDDELEDEVVEECQLYGKVLKSIVFLQPGATEEEAVRIFVMFESTDSAIQAYGDLHRRAFDGRIVNAVFYEEKNFVENKFDLPLKMPNEDEVIQEYQKQQQEQEQMEIEQMNRQFY